MTTKFTPGTPSWVDIGSTDVAGTTEFYSALFGWTVEDLGPDSGGYGMIRQHGKQVAGVGPATDPDRGTSWSTYFATDDAEETTARVEANGGKVIMPPMDVMDQGRMAVYTDPTGAFFSVWQAGAHKGAELVNEHGSLSWAELMTTDIAAAKAFYEAVFPITTRDVEIGPDTTYTLIQSGDKDVAGAMAIGPEMAGMPSHWSVYFAVDNCDEAADRAIALGATEMLRHDSPAGRFSILTDPQGGKFSVIQNDPDFSM